MNRTTAHIEALLKDDGHQFAQIRKADLQALVDEICSRDHLDQLGELRRTMAEQKTVIDEAFECITKQARIARKHGDERRRYMGNNRALLAHAEHQEATMLGMGEVIDDQAAEIAELKANVESWRGLSRQQRGRALYSESQLAILRSILK